MTASEEERYSEVSVSNFNYYEVVTATTAMSVSVVITLHSGAVDLYHSTDKLPTRDTESGHTGKYPSASVSWVTTGAVTSMTVPISLSQMNKNKLKVYLGIYGNEASAYDITVTETLLPGAMSTGPIAIDYVLGYKDPTTVNLVAGEYYFLAVPTGVAGESKSMPSRSGPGSRVTRAVGWEKTSTASRAAWGIDWWEPLTPTWIRNHADENDVDVSITLTATTATTVQVYGSSREVFTSAERGYDVTGSLVSGSGSATLTIPHYTFGDQVIYISLKSSTTQSVTFTLSKTEQSRAVSTDTATAKGSCAALASCSGQGSCVNEKCFCDDGYTGDKCDVAAFLGTDSAPSNPRVVISALWPGVNAPFAEDATIAIPYEVRSAPPYSKVRLRVDGKPWPDRIGSVMHLGATGTPASGSTTYFTVDVMGLQGNLIDHTLQVYLTAASGKLLDAAERSFQTKKTGGCAPDSAGNACSGKGLCFNGYCVCYDGFIGTDCSITDSTRGSNLASGETGAASYTSPGVGFKAGAAYTAHHKMNTTNKIAFATTGNTMQLAAVKSELEAVTASLKAKDLSTHTTIEAKLDSIAATVAFEKAARDAKVLSLNKKLDDNGMAIQQDLLSSERSKTARLEAHIDSVRSLHQHQKEVQNRLDNSLAEIKAGNKAKMDKVARHLAENEFVMNQVKLMNGPTVPISKLTKGECEVDQFYGVSCNEAPDTLGQGIFGQAPPPSATDPDVKMDASKTGRG
jgi:hypothetical protein